MKKIFTKGSIITLLGLFILTGCSINEVEGVSDKADPGETKQVFYNKKLYYLDKSAVIEDRMTGDLLIYTEENSYGGRNPVYKLYKSRESMSPELIKKLVEEVGYYDPWEAK